MRGKREETLATEVQKCFDREAPFGRKLWTRGAIPSNQRALSYATHSNSAEHSGARHRGTEVARKTGFIDQSSGSAR